jgi:hypothetical protein
MAASATDPGMDAVLARLDAIAQSVQRLEARAQGSAGTPLPNRRITPIKAPLERVQSQESVRSGSDDVYSTEEEALARAARPSFYPHTPKRRTDTIVEVSRSHRNADTLEFLQLKEMQGLYNLSALLLVFTITYIVVRNVLENGFRQDPLGHFFCPEAGRDAIVGGSIAIGSLVASFCVYGLQAAVSSRWLAESAMLVLYTLIQVSSVSAACVAVYTTAISPLNASGALCTCLILALKCHSYIFTNMALASEKASTDARKRDEAGEDADDEGDTDPRRGPEAADGAAKTTSGEIQGTGSSKTTGLRHRRKGRGKRSGSGHDGSGTTAIAPSPGVPTPADFVYFLACPSLVYEPHFPRLKRRRWGLIARKLVEFSVCMVLEYSLLTQFLLPVLATPHKHGPLMDIAKLAVPSMAVWLIGFYALFHCLLIANSELLLFADQRFYDAWWSATSIDAFWRLWNKPVHEFLLRHVYVESIHYAHMGKQVALFIVFLLSAAAHEIIFSVSFKTARPWFALGMLAQIPLIAISRQFKGTRRGNFIVWFSLFLGQPMIEILYFREWMNTHNGKFFCLQDPVKPIGM